MSRKESLESLSKSQQDRMKKAIKRGEYAGRLLRTLEQGSESDVDWYFLTGTLKNMVTRKELAEQVLDFIDIELKLSSNEWTWLRDHNVLDKAKEYNLLNESDRGLFRINVVKKEFDADEKEQERLQEELMLEYEHEQEELARMKCIKAIAQVL